MSFALINVQIRGDKPCTLAFFTPGWGVICKTLCFRSYLTEIKNMTKIVGSGTNMCAKFHHNPGL